VSSRILCEKLLKSYEFLFGRLHNRDEFKAALQQVLSDEDIKVIFLTPFIGEMSMAELEQKAIKVGIHLERLHKILPRLILEGFVESYIQPECEGQSDYQEPESLLDMRRKGRFVTRGSLITMVELQVRKQAGDSLRGAAMHYLDAMVQNGAKAPYYRV
jgi:hypothetical protein